MYDFMGCKRPAVDAVSAILEGDGDSQKRSILKHGPLPALRDLLRHDDVDDIDFDFDLRDDITTRACEVIMSVVALGQDHVEAVIQHQIIHLLVKFARHSYIRVPALKAIDAAVSNGTTNQICVMGSVCIRTLCKCLDGYDPSGSDIEEVMYLALKALGRILRAGESGSRTNPMAVKVEEAGGLDELRSVRHRFSPCKITAKASGILRTYFGDEESRDWWEESEASEDEGEDDNGTLEPPRQRPRTA